MRNNRAEQLLHQDLCFLHDLSAAHLCRLPAHVSSNKYRHEMLSKHQLKKNVGFNVKFLGGEELFQIRQLSCVYRK